MTAPVRPSLLVVGVNTGNSLDAADAVLTRFDRDGSIRDLATHSVSLPRALGEKLRLARAAVNQAHGAVDRAAEHYARAGEGTLLELIDAYTRFVAGSVAALQERAAPEAVDLIGFHGQTCAHRPPSRSEVKDPREVYTVQLGDGQLLADLTGTAVAYDFRSDDLMNGGEGAPLAPRHHQHLAAGAKREGRFPLAFVNAGNTGNLTVIGVDQRDQKPAVLGWDAGPFNDFPDRLMQLQRGAPCDLDGATGARGQVHEGLLRVLFETAVPTVEGKNYLEQPLPRSSDPQWYRLVPQLTGEQPLGPQPLRFEDRLRTAEYFGAYLCFHSLGLLPPWLEVPRYFALCGGGWNNPVARAHFEALVEGRFEAEKVLGEHRALFERIRERCLASGGLEPPRVDGSLAYGYDGAFMEARLFADAAVCRITGEPFTEPATTGASGPTVCGLLRFPSRAPLTPALSGWLDHFGSRELTFDAPALFDGRWSRASRGWFDRRAKAGGGSGGAR